MDKILLPVETSPFFLSDFDRIGCVNIIRAQARAAGKDVTPWLIGQMANLQLKADLFNDNNPNLTVRYSNQKVFLKKYYQSDNRLPFWDRQTVLNLLIDTLCKGEYVCPSIDTRHLTDDASYGAYSRKADGLIYGVDKAKKEFYYIRFLPSNPVTLCVASFDEMIKAISEKENHRVEWDSMRLNPDYSFELDEVALCKDLFDFITPRDKFSPVQHMSTPLNGIDYMSAFRNYLCRVGIDCEYIDYRMFTSIYDFQTLECMRFKYLKDNGYITEETFDAFAAQLPNLSKQFLIGCLSYNQKHNAGILREVIGVYDQIVEIDLRLSEAMWRALKARIPVKEPEKFPFPYLV